MEYKRILILINHRTHVANVSVGHIAGYPKAWVLLYMGNT